MSIVEDLYKEIEQGLEGKNVGLKTGLPKLDWYTGGFQKSMYRLIFGKSGSGKTSLTTYTLYRLLKDYPNTNMIHLYFSMEMRGTVLLAKLLNLYMWETYQLDISFMDIFSIREPLSKEIYDKVLEAKLWLNKISNKIIIYDNKMNADFLYAKLMEFYEEHGEWTASEDGHRQIYVPNDPTLIVNAIIDHGGLFQPSKGRTKKEEIDLASSYLVRFREVCGLSVDFLLQENRTAGTSDRLKMDMSEPTLDDVKESGNPGNDCNICIAVYNPLDYKRKTYRDYQVIGGDCLGSAIRGLLILKSRFGSAHKAICCGFMGSNGLFEELPDPDKIDYSKYQSWKDEKFEKSSDEDEIPQESKREIVYNF